MQNTEQESLILGTHLQQRRHGGNAVGEGYLVLMREYLQYKKLILLGLQDEEYLASSKKLFEFGCCCQWVFNQQL